MVATRHKAIKDLESMSPLYHKGSVFVFVLIVDDRWLSSVWMRPLAFENGDHSEGGRIGRRVQVVAKWAADLKRGFDRTCLPLGVGQKMIDYIGHAREAINATQFAVDTIVTKPVAHR